MASPTPEQCPKPAQDGDRCALPIGTAQEMTFTSQRGSPVLTPERTTLRTIDARVGQRIVCPSLFGYYEAAILEIDGDKAVAENTDLYFFLFKNLGEWWCDSSANKEAVRWLTEVLRR